MLLLNREPCKVRDCARLNIPHPSGPATAPHGMARGPAVEGILAPREEREGAARSQGTGNQNVNGSGHGPAGPADLATAGKL